MNIFQNDGEYRDLCVNNTVRHHFVTRMRIVIYYVLLTAKHEFIVQICLSCHKFEKNRVEKARNNDFVREGFYDIHNLKSKLSTL